MKAVVYNIELNSYEYRTDVPKPVSGKDWVRIAVKYSSINPIDLKLEAWKESIMDCTGTNFVAGTDVAGIIDYIPEEDRALSQWKIGDRVVSHLWIPDGHGAFSEFCLCKADYLVSVPAEVSLAEAAVTPASGWAAYKALTTKMNVQPDTSILITGGNGGLGGYALQLAKLKGCKTIITTCSNTSFSRVSTLGATHCIDYATADIVAQVDFVTEGEGVDYILDTIGSESASKLSKTLRYDGQIACTAGIESIENLCFLLIIY